MAKASGNSRTGTTKKTGAATGKAASGKKPPAAGSPQRRKDPAFMKNLETAILDEYSRTKQKALPEPEPVARTPSAEKAVAAKKVAPEKKASSARKPSSPKKAAGSGRKALAAELSSLIPDLDAEGLAFLIEQARVHLYNMRVADLETAAEEAERASSRARSTGAAAAKGPKAAGDSGELSIQAASDGSAYDLVHNGKWKMFTGEEMMAMVRIASSKDPVDQVGGRLYRWLLAERSDAINDLGLSGLADPLLKRLVALLRKTFTIKGAK
ncbi:MAG: hypothetical protein CVV47_11700 [Spirochaetae bacterium HGW-Spirochaetae-3]|jgi:hypothetical protein|nr:MAG: hypothetical protein CVV47_11700 [Spirochaetae bacterium HGW-Spirochaetae-3]